MAHRYACRVVERASECQVVYLISVIGRLFSSQCYVWAHQVIGGAMLKGLRICRTVLFSSRAGGKVEKTKKAARFYQRAANLPFYDKIKPWEKSSA